MTMSPPESVEGRMVSRSLSQISIELRRTVAEEIVVRGKLHGEDVMKMMLAAEAIFGDPVLEVPEEKALLVDAGKRPPGPTPRVWEW